MFEEPISKNELIKSILPTSAVPNEEPNVLDKTDKIEEEFKVDSDNKDEDDSNNEDDETESTDKEDVVDETMIQLILRRMKRLHVLIVKRYFHQRGTRDTAQRRAISV